MDIQPPIPTQLVTGFLGAGKTTLIRHWLARKPVDEHWAVLINEFGEIGIDDQFVGEPETHPGGVTLRQVPGGCLCCSAGLLFQVALNDVIRRVCPDRLLIEPTGLGHPRALLQTLSGPHYQGVLSLQATVTLVDARQLHSERHRQHPVFNDQLAVADVIVAHKSDTYSQADRDALTHFLVQNQWHQTPLVYSQQGDLALDWLAQPSRFTPEPENRVRHETAPGDSVWQSTTPDFNDSRIIQRSNTGDGYHSLGWLIEPGQLFDPVRLRTWLDGLELERIKGAFITTSGIFGYNRAGKDVQWWPLDEIGCSRLELIDPQALPGSQLEQGLIATLSQ
ncbi:MAG: CobW family GTP-binding protein [Saccharospirillum sp.]